MPKTLFPSMMKRINAFQSDSGIRFCGSARLRRVDFLGNARELPDDHPRIKWRKW